MSKFRQHPHEPTRRPLAHGERVEWHFHTANQLICPGRGVLRVSTPDGRWVVPPHRAVWLPAGVPHAHQAYGPAELRCLAFPAEVNPLRLEQPAVLAVTPLLREVIALLSGPDPPAGEQLRTLEQVALDQLRQAPPLELLLPTPSDPRLRDVTDLLVADPADQRSLARLGAAVGASERTLSRLFRRDTGMSFPQWRTQLRLQHSLTLLAAGHSVTAVAAATGYSSPSAFVEAFRLAFGTTPGRHQREGGH
ncbi:helix-turn-helix transcriptional regulator [Kitasatospora sp. NBC_00240]|uniref:AraC family transcriptional regulator n=1 Tax=Kitasatospora sp. NBC_00240 TaxID=2903567 RepID=UPI00224CB911|nr:helix-turn-helix transcriptional regulator [Kitasatospora sp. NBC_00240]MCX5207906.1 helix-turn-helix transcriptional regulator [Kitasatospora sp. NBC_00240]